ncbi:glycosyltransferase family 2 protein [bacterium]|nr:glycosyltransferase family 2 protein [bacterium]
MSESKEFSVVIPVYNSEGTLRELTDKITSAMEDISGSYEIIYVDDSSRDDSWNTLNSLYDKSGKINIIRLSKNFGQDNAVFAGLRSCRGGKVIIMDDDLQQSPEDIPVLLTHMKENDLDVVFGRFSRKRQSLFKNFGSAVNNRMATLLLKKRKGLYLSSFKIITRSVLREMLKYEGPFPCIDCLVMRTTDNYGQIDVTHRKRKKGRSNYTMRRLLSVWSNSITNFSIIPLRTITWMGIFVSIIAFVFLIYSLVERIYFNTLATPDWMSIASVLLFLGGIQLLSLGVIGEYIGRLFLNTNRSPQFVIREKREVE